MPKAYYYGPILIPSHPTLFHEKKLTLRSIADAGQLFFSL